VDKLLAELRDTFVSMTLEQRRHLKIIVSLQDENLDGDVVRTLVDLGLVVKLGDTYCATSAGGYVSRLYRGGTSANTQTNMYAAIDSAPK
jgi:hypothetical protein